MPISAIQNMPGRLYSGSRQVTTFERASLEPLGSGHWRLVAVEHKPDPYWFEHCDHDRPMLCYTRLGRMRARFVADEPLTLEIWSNEDE